MVTFGPLTDTISLFIRHPSNEVRMSLYIPPPTSSTYMKYNYPNNTNDTNVTYMRTREGPNHFRVYYKNGAQIRLTPKEVGAVFGIARFTPTVNEIRDWCYTMIHEYGSDDDKLDDNYIKYIEKQKKN